METGGAPEQLTLYVKAGCDGKRYGACPFCQRVFMVLLLKAKAHLQFKVVSVNLTKPLFEFRALGLKRVPAIVHGEEVFDNVDDILYYLDVKFPKVDLYYDNVFAENVCKNFFSKFCYFIKEVSKEAGALEYELKKICDYMKSRKTLFLCGDQLTHLDCEVLPKLQQIRVSLMGLKDYETPSSFEGLWRYMYNAYNDDIFVKSCPSDQEILLHWAEKPETPRLSNDKYTKIMNQKQSYSFDIPVRWTPANAE